jgi:hypothetical protein
VPSILTESAPRAKPFAVAPLLDRWAGRLADLIESIGEAEGG